MLRGLGARDLVLAAGALWTSLRNGAARSWPVAAVAGEVTDVSGALVAGDALPPRRRRDIAVVAHGFEHQ